MAINQLKAGAFLSYVSIALNNIVGLLYMPFMLRMMGQTEYGLYSLAASVVAYLTVLDLGFGNAIVRYTAKFRAENKKQEQYEMFGMFLILYSVVGILTLLIGSGLYFNVDRLFGETMTPDELRKIQIMIFLMIFNLAVSFPMGIWGAILCAYEKFVFMKLIHIVRIILNPLVMIMMLMIGYRAIGMVVVTTIFNIITLLLNWWYCKKRLQIRICFRKMEWSFLKEVSLYSFWIFLNIIMDRIYWSTGQFILGIYSGAAVIAIYAVAIQLQQIYMGFSTAISGVFLPKVTAMVTKEHNEKAVSDLFIRTGRIQYIIMAFILTGFIVFGRHFIVLWAGSDYEGSYIISLLFFIPLTVPLIQNLGIVILQARNRMKFRSLLYLLIAISSLLISMPLAKVYGGVGCAVGTASALIAGQIIAMNIYYQKKIHIDIICFWREIAKMSIVPLIIGFLSLCIVHHYPLNTVPSLIVGILLFMLLYIPVFWFFGMNSYERNLLIKPIRKFIPILKN